jgi:hypothetical protein
MIPLDRISSYRGCCSALTVTAAVLAALSFAVPAHAQDEPPATESAQLPQAVDEEVVVRGRRMSEIEDDLRIQVDAFIDEIVALPFGKRGFARWDRSVCVGVHNLQKEPAQYLVDRVSLLAAEVGLTPGEPGCSPEVIIIFSTDGKATARYIVDEMPTTLRPTGNDGVHRGLAALERFADSDAPVRWWHLSLPVDARTGRLAIRMDGSGIPWIRVAGPSRIHSGISDAMWQVVIIVDSTKLVPGTTWQQLGDYLAVVSLAQVDAETNPAAFDSILNLFTNPKAYSGLTDWDRSYVRALYDFDQERNPNIQRGDLRSHMVRGEIDRGAQ